MGKPTLRVSCYGSRGVGFPFAWWLTGFLAYRWLIPMVADGWHMLVAAWWRLRLTFVWRASLSQGLTGLAQVVYAIGVG